MVATVRLDDNLEEKLEHLTSVLHQKKSDVIRDAINHYAKSIENDKKSRMQKALEKVKNEDSEINKDFEGTISDGL
ncbi:MAG TPA: ribbon-helix-helix protein, CopG family [Arcobacter sp.]|jgi:predicted transcriptional regulator|nr:ribbon-helix-helix protein, CopG family [Arcobacter sp.]